MSGDNERTGAIALRWWNGLTDPRRGDRGARAQLRRCQTALEALPIVQALALARQLGKARQNSAGLDDALGLAIVLAHVKEHDSANRLMQVAGWKTFPGEKKETESENRPLLSELRFRRLLQTMQDEKVDAFKRLVRILGGNVNIADLAESFLFWGDKVRQRWAFEYFAAGQSAPFATQLAQGAEQ